jgi:hypothetical protein
MSKICTKNFSLSIEDEKTVIGLLNNYDSASRYYYIIKQTDEEYSKLLSDSKKSNEDICSCSLYGDISRNNGWTTYNFGFKNSCSFSPACYQPPAYCPNSTYFSITLFFVVIGILLIGLIWFYKSRKTSMK